MITLRTATAARLPRAAVAVLLLLTVLCWAGGPTAPALAAGTGGIEVTPVPGVVDGQPVTAFHVDVPSRGTESVPFLLRNVEDGERSARIYTARVTRDAAGTFTLGEPGSSPFVAYADQEVTLAPGEARDEAFTVLGGKVGDGDELAAVVVEVRRGSIVQRASTLIYLDRGRVVPLPLLAVVAAVLVLTAAAVAVALAARRRRAEDAAP